MKASSSRNSTPAPPNHLQRARESVGQAGSWKGRVLGSHPETDFREGLFPDLLHAQTESSALTHSLTPFGRKERGEVKKGGLG